MKQKTRYQCTNCKHISIKWIGCCPQCSEWNSLSKITQAATSVFENKNTKTINAARLHSLESIKTNNHERMISGIDEWDRVVGGGILPGSFIILTGDPGIGKSTLLLKVASKIASKHSVIYFSSEESLQQVKNRSKRLDSEHKNVLFSDKASLEAIIATGKQEKPALLIVDSIQNCYQESSNTIPGTVAQLREAGFHLMQLAKEHNVAVLATGHITKDGHMAGPKLLEHMVDGVFYLQGDNHWHTRILRSVKNRFGAINEVGFFEMSENGLQPVSDISKQCLEQATNSPGSALIATLEGSRSLLLELQALSVPTKFGMPQRVITGIDPKRVIIVAAILEKYLKVRLSGNDIFFKVSGNFKIKNSSSDLGIALALLSSYFQKPLPEKSIALGELSLTGQVKPAHQVESCIREAERFGVQTVFVARNQKVKTSCALTTFRHVYELLNLFPEDK